MVNMLAKLPIIDFVTDYIEDQGEIVYIDSDVICINDPIIEIQKHLDKMKKMNYFISAKTDSTRAVNEDLFDRLNIKMIHILMQAFY